MEAPKRRRRGVRQISEESRRSQTESEQSIKRTQRKGAQSQSRKDKFKCPDGTILEESHTKKNADVSMKDIDSSDEDSDH